MKKAGWIFIAAVIFFCGFGFYAVRWMVTKSKIAKTSPPVSVAQGNVVSSVLDTGTIEAERTVEVKSRVQGILKKLFVKEGEFVKQGELVALIDPEETQLQVAQNKAQLMGAQSAYNKARLLVTQRRITAQDALASANLTLEQLREQSAIQPKLTQALIAQAQSQYNSAKADFNQLTESSIPTQKSANLSALNQAKANVENATAEEARDKDLLSKGFVSQKTYEDALLQVQLAQATLSSAQETYKKQQISFNQQIAKSREAMTNARAALESAQANSIQNKVKRQEYLGAVAQRDSAIASLQDIPILKEDVLQSLASVQQNQSVLKDSERLLGYTTVKSPISGVVTLKEIQEGELVASLSSFSSGTPIVRIEDRSAMRVTLDMNEIDVEKIRLGMKADVTVDALPGEHFEGTVTRIAPSSINENNTSTTTSSAASSTASSGSVVKFGVEIHVDNPSSDLKGGLSAKVHLISAEVDNVLYVPVEYLGKDKAGTFLMLAPTTPKGKPTRETVTSGLNNGAVVEIKSGATPGQKLVKPVYNGPAMQRLNMFGPN